MDTLDVVVTDGSAQVIGPAGKVLVIDRGSSVCTGRGRHSEIERDADV